MYQKILIFAILFSLSNCNPQNFTNFTQNPCENITLGYVPYEADCSYYIFCENEVATIFRCPSGQIFHPTEWRCYYGDYETCEPYTTTVAPPQLPNSCPEFDDPYNPVFFPHPTDCSRYFMCYNTTLIERECYEGFFWSVENEWCDFPENVNCDRITTTLQPTQPPQYCIDWILCPQSGFGNLPDFNICHRFFECIMGVRHLRTCPGRQIFDVNKLRCDYPEYSLCVKDAECREI